MTIYINIYFNVKFNHLNLLITIINISICPGPAVPVIQHVSHDNRGSTEGHLYQCILLQVIINIVNLLKCVYLHYYCTKYIDGRLSL